MASRDKCSIFPAYSFDAEHIIKYMLDKNFHVNALVKDDCRKEFFDELKKQYDNFEYRIVEIDDEKGLREALDGSKFIIHLSHSIYETSKEYCNKLIRCLEAFMGAVKDVKGLNRLLFVSTLGTVCNLEKFDELVKSGRPITEKCYNEDATMDSMSKSSIRVEFEKRFFELAKKYNIDHVVLNPSLFVGPLLSKREKGRSIQYIKSFFEGKEVTDVYPLIDVRDLSAACYNALTTPDIKDKYMVTQESFTYPKEIYEILKTQFPDINIKEQRKTGSKNQVFDMSNSQMDVS